jgi:hypothetical protein
MKQWKGTADPQSPMINGNDAVKKKSTNCLLILDWQIALVVAFHN